MNPFTVRSASAENTKKAEAKFVSWMTLKLPGVVNSLETSITSTYHLQGSSGLGIAGRAEVISILDDLLSSLFPGGFSDESLTDTDLHFFLTNRLQNAAYRLYHHCKLALEQYCDGHECEDCDCADKAACATQGLLEELPKIRAVLLTDVETAYHGDPAAKSFDEIILAYPGLEAIATHRIAHCLYEMGIPIIPRVMSERAHSRTGIDIHPGAKIGKGFFIDHGTGVVVGETTTIGDNVKIYQGVTLGATSPFDRDGRPRTGVKRHPDIEDDVIIYANATILGGKTVIGRGAVVGGNTWITSSVAPGAVVLKE